MVEMVKNRYWKKFVIGILSFTAIVVIGLSIALVLSLMNGGDSGEPNTYYGPPQDDAEYEIKFQSTLAEGSGEVPIEIGPSWVGISIEASYSSACEGTIDIISPSGILITTFEFSLTEDEISESIEDTSSGQYVTLKPGAWPGEIYGEWVFRYSLEGGPSNIIISKIISFGSPS